MFLCNDNECLHIHFFIDDGNQFRIHQANTLITAYTSQIDALNLQITQLAHTVSTPITPLAVQHNAELAR